MKKYFNFSNLLLLFLIMFLVYVVFGGLANKDRVGEKRNITAEKDLASQGKPKEEENYDPESFDLGNSPETNKNIENDGPNKVLPEAREKLIKDIEKESSPRDPFDYKLFSSYFNSTYAYKLKFPREWPLGAKGKEDIFLGYAPPQKGEGAIFIQAGEKADREIKKLQSRLATTSEEIIKSRGTIFLDKLPAQKYSFLNPNTGEKKIYLKVESGGRNYLIFYTQSGPEINTEKFLPRVSRVLDSFQFFSS